MSYLKSLIKIENNPNYLHSEYNIYLSYCKEGVSEEQEKYIAKFYNKIHESFFFETYKRRFSYEKDYYNFTISWPVPKEYFKIILIVDHYYEKEKIILKELDYCPPNAFKKDQCVICLNNKPNILYERCLHFCICDKCDSNKTLKNCPYCRTKIEKRPIVKNI